MESLRMHRLFFTLSLVVALLLAVGTVRVARAFEFDTDGTVAADEVVDDDLFLSYDIVVMDGTVNGDLFVSGDSVTINGTVHGNVLVFGTTVLLNGTVDNSVAFAGQSLRLDGDVGGSIYAIGSALTLEPESQVGRNIMFSGASLMVKQGASVARDVHCSSMQAQLGGEVGRNVEAEVDALALNGHVGGDVRASVGEPAPAMPIQWPGAPNPLPSGLHVNESARIDGQLTYRSPVEQAEAILSAPAGGVAFEQTEAENTLAQQLAQALKKRLHELITLLILGGLVAWRAPALLGSLAEQARQKPLPAVGWGMVGLLGGYLGAGVIAVVVFLLGLLLAIVSLGDLALGVLGTGFAALTLLLTLFWLLVAYGSKLVVAYLGGRMILQRLAPQPVAKAIWPLLLGIGLYMLLRLVPLLGWLVGAAATLVGLGAAWLWARQRRTAPPAAEQVQDKSQEQSH